MVEVREIPPLSGGVAPRERRRSGRDDSDETGTPCLGARKPLKSAEWGSVEKRKVRKRKTEQMRERRKYL
jgi:hypothetical protein